MSCGVGCRRGSDPALLWLWRRPVATAPIQPLAWEPPYAAGAAQEIAIATTTTTKRQKKTKKKKRMVWKIHLTRNEHEIPFSKVVQSEWQSMNLLKYTPPQ